MAGTKYGLSFDRLIRKSGLFAFQDKTSRSEQRVADQDRVREFALGFQMPVVVFPPWESLARRENVFQLKIR